MKYGNWSIKRVIEFMKHEKRLYKQRYTIKFRRFKKKMPKIRGWLKDNWVGLALDLGVLASAALLGLLIGGFIGFIFVLNALMGA